MGQRRSAPSRCTAFIVFTFTCAGFVAQGGAFDAPGDDAAPAPSVMMNDSVVGDDAMLDEILFLPRAASPSILRSAAPVVPKYLRAFVPNAPGAPLSAATSDAALIVQEEVSSPRLADEDYELVVRDEPIVFRTFMVGVGTHAIAVGFPCQTHIVFDAQRVRLAKVWQGKFLNARPTWEGDGGQFAQPGGDDVFDLPADGALALLEGPDAPWPRAAGAEAGYSMQGYRFDGNRVPIFMYRVQLGAQIVEVEEQAETGAVAQGGALVRSFRLRGGAAVSLVFRAAVADHIERREDGTYLLDGGRGLRMILPLESQPRIRMIDGKQELLVPITLALSGADESEDQLSAEVRVEMTW